MFYCKSIMSPLLFLSVFSSTSFADESNTPVKIPSNASCEVVIKSVNELVLTHRQETNWERRQKHNRAQLTKATTANDLNNYGMRCYKEKRFTDAAVLFRWAITIDENHVLANYNLACVIAILLKEQGPCEMDETFESAIPLLQHAVKLDPNRAIRALKDPYLDSLRMLLGFNLAIYGSPKNPSDMARLFDGITLWGDTPGVALLAEISFTRTNEKALTGTVSGWIRENSNFKQVHVEGTWRATDSTIVVDWSDYKIPEEGDDLHSTKGKGWTETIAIDKLNHYGHGGWFSMPDWCNA